MSRNRPSALRAMRARLPHALESALTAFLYAAGLLLPLCSALALPVGAADILLACAGFSLLFALVSLSPLTAVLGALGALVALMPYALGLPGQLPGLAEALALAAQGAPLALRLYAGVLYPLLALLFALLAFVLARANGGFYPAFALAAFVLLATWFYGTRGNVLLCLPALAALVLLYARSGEHGATILRALPTALAAALLAALLMPAAAPVSQAMTNFAERVRSVVYDYFFFTEPRTVFSLLLSGYQPLGADRLGGPANPTDDLVLRVQADETAYLRGVIKDEYTGAAWRDTVAGRRYLFIDPRFHALRDALFDADLPAQDLRAGNAAFDERTITVAMLADGTSTLFVPQRLTSISSAEGFVPYFGSSSEVFITRDTQAGDAYTVTAPLPSADDPGIGQLLLQAHSRAQSRDGSAGASDWTAICETYAVYPESVEDEVVRIVSYLVQDAATPYERALRIANFLGENYPYTLDQSVPPTGRDFVSWFLLEERQGYCTSFASAMAVMCRIAGLPARYVEGYVARPGDGGVAHVSQQDAHAWVEVCFEGFGWLTFDPTPAQGSDTPDTPDAGGSDDPQASPAPDAPTPTPNPNGDSQGEDAQGEDEGAPGQGGASPTPDASVPTPTPTPDPQESPEPEDSPAPDDPIASPTPEPTPEPSLPPDATPSPEPSPPPPDDPPDERTPRWPWLLALLVLAAAFALRVLWTDPARAAARQRSDEARLLCWYRGAESALYAAGLARLPGESPLAFARRAEAALGRGVRLTPFVRALCLVQYGGRAASPDWLQRAERCYHALQMRLTLRQRARMIVRRALRGLGSLKSL